MRLLNAARSPRLTPAALAEAQGVAAALSSDDRSLQAERARGWGMIHREWLATDAARLQLQQKWQELFREFDAVIYPAAAVPAFPHDHSEPFDARQLDIDGKLHPYSDACFIWADPASTCGLPATAVPIERTASGLPIGVQIIGPYLEDRTTIALAGLIEREFGGFVPPPALPAK
jgi:amidase